MATRKKLSNRRKRQISRDCWNLDFAFYKWVLEHLKVYLKDATGIINLEYHTEEYNGKVYTQREAIERMISLCEMLISRESNIWSEEYHKCEEELMDLWRIWYGYMWW